MLRNIKYGVEAVLLVVSITFFRLLPLDAASALGGLLGRMIGPFLGVHRVAGKNIAMALPELSEAERGKVLSDMWDNLGRIIGEYPHISRKIMARRITIEGLEHLQNVKNSEVGSFFISGHFANWEIAPLTAAIYGLPMVLIYRAANNPVADWLICRIRSRYNTAMYGKGREGAQQSIKAVKAGKAVGMLVDQKMNDGEAVPFFGRDAMTATAAISMAMKLEVPLLAARVVRTHGVHFHVTLQPPVIYDKNTDAKAAMLELHRIFEYWIREHPAQWFWVHNRWGK